MTPAVPSKPFQMTGERDEAFQGAITVLRSRARYYGDSPLANQMRSETRRYEMWADVLEEAWEELR